MSERAFNRFYNFTFPIYKFLVRQAFLLVAVLRLDFLDSRRWRRALRVYATAPYSLVGTSGLEATFNEGMRLNDLRVPGDFVELGVARGGCAALMAFAAFDKGNTVPRNLWLFDSYEGLPDPGQNDYTDEATTGDHVRPLPKGSCLGTLEEVRGLVLGRFGFNPDRVNFVKGWFQDTVPPTAPKIAQIAMLRLDGDWYESTKICLDYMFDCVAPGGSIIIDDYLTCIGSKRAVDDFIRERKLDTPLVFDGRGGCSFRKAA